MAAAAIAAHTIAAPITILKATSPRFSGVFDLISFMTTSALSLK